MAFTSDKEDKQLFSRADDTVRLCELRHSPCFMGFLNERERFLLEKHLGWFSGLEFFGGYENASRVIMGACEREIDRDEFPLEKLCFKFRKTDRLSHRDFLSSLMGLGIERDCVGDILIGEGFAAVFVKSEIAPYVKSQLTKVGRVGVKLIPESECDISYKPETEEKCVILSSMRLDVIVAALTGLSRGKTSELILSGKVFVNYLENKNVSHTLGENDILTIRGKGKFIIKEQSGTTKKGRVKINIVHYR